MGGTEQPPRWERIVRDGVRRWIRSPRDVVRIANAVKFSWSAIEGEMDPQDLMAMEGLRLFDAGAFEWVRENRSLILRKDRYLAPPDGAREAVVDRLKQVVPARMQPEALDLVGALFPQLAGLLRDKNDFRPSEDHVDVAQRRGVGSEAGYDSYFSLHPSVGAVPLSELNRLVAAADASEIEGALLHYLHTENSTGRRMIGNLLEELYFRYNGENAAPPTQAMLDALFAVGEQILGADARSPGMLDLLPRTDTVLVVSAMMYRWGPAEGGRFLIEAFRKTDSPAFLAAMFVAMGQDRGVFEPSNRNEPAVSQEDFDVLGELLREKIQTSERAGTLADCPFFFDIVQSWRHLCGPNDPRRWLLSGMTSEATFMVKVCRGLVGGATKAGKTEYRLWDMPDEELYDLRVLNQAARAHLGGTELTNDECSLIAALADGTDRMLEARSARHVGQTTRLICASPRP